MKTKGHLTLKLGRWEYNPNARCDFTVDIVVCCDAYSEYKREDERELSEDYNNGIYDTVIGYKCYDGENIFFLKQLITSCYYGGDESWSEYKIKGLEP